MKRIHSWSDVKCHEFSSLVSFFVTDVVVIDNVSDFPTAAIDDPVMTIKWKLVTAKMSKYNVLEEKQNRKVDLSF